MENCTISTYLDVLFRKLFEGKENESIDIECQANHTETLTWNTAAWNTVLAEADKRIKEEFKFRNVDDNFKKNHGLNTIKRSSKLWAEISQITTSKSTILIKDCKALSCELDKSSEFTTDLTLTSTDKQSYTNNIDKFQEVEFNHVTEEDVINFLNELD